jgi:hypothetical protein
VAWSNAVIIKVLEPMVRLETVQDQVPVAKLIGSATKL